MPGSPHRRALTGTLSVCENKHWPRKGEASWGRWLGRPCWCWGRVCFVPLFKDLVLSIAVMREAQRGCAFLPPGEAGLLLGWWGQGRNAHTACQLGCASRTPSPSPQSLPAGPSGLAGAAARHRVVVVASPEPDAVRTETYARDGAHSSETAIRETALSVSKRGVRDAWSGSPPHWYGVASSKHGVRDAWSGSPPHWYGVASSKHGVRDAWSGSPPHWYGVASSN